MFTPPPSPNPIPQSSHPFSPSTKTLPSKSPTPSPMEKKRRTGRRTCWAIFVVPLVLIFITLSSRYVTHPAFFDIFATSSVPSVRDIVKKGSDWTLHRRHPQAEIQTIPSISAPSATPSSVSVNSSSSMVLENSEMPTATNVTSAPSSTIAITAQSLPTIPSTPPTLPTPFPQPFDDGSLSSNFTVQCFNFFVNMTNDLAFRQCRPFSLLQMSSNGFTSAQNNLTLLNSIIWGTCNTTPGKPQCVSNMEGFATRIKTECAQDISAEVAVAVDTLTAIEAYSVMFEAACSIDPTSKSYCYLSAVKSTNLGDISVYQLPLGQDYPSGQPLTCSPCISGTLQTYSADIKDSSMELDGLSKTLPDALAAATQICKSDFVQPTSNGNLIGPWRFWLLLIIGTSLLRGFV